MAGKNLYWGRNDSHEFWESEDRDLLILRVDRETAWTAHRDYRFLFACDTARQGAEQLNSALCNDRVWKKSSQGIFRLVSRTSRADNELSH